MKTIVPFIVLLSLTGLACQQNASSTAHLGEVELQITGSPEAQTHFREGLLLLHSFEYDDARVAFEEALATDPACAMAYWGAAMTHNHSLWGQQNYAKGREILHRLDSLVEVSALTPLEQDFMAAAQILYGEQEDKTVRNQAYADQMAVLYQRYPGQHEVAAFYALSLLGSVPEGRDVEVFGQGARIAQGIMAENPQHPGALHYLIHSYDDPQHASLALLAANNYAKVAPDATHALHMPSHIYVALGMWEEVIRSNIASYAASVKRMEALSLDHNARSYHALAWLLYGYLQQENFEEADRIMQEMSGYTQALPSKKARAYFITMTGNYLVETGRWDSEFAQLDLELKDLGLRSQAQVAFIRGMVAWHRQDIEALGSIIDQMERERMTASLTLSEEGARVCGAAPGSLPSQMTVDHATIMEMELRGLLADLNQQEAEAEKWLQKATDLQSSISFDNGPPEVAYPSWELYGEWLARQNRTEEAQAQFQKALEYGPKRRKAEKGLETTLAMAN